MTLSIKSSGAPRVLLRLGLLAGLLLAVSPYCPAQDENLGPLSPEEAERLKARSLSDWEGIPLSVAEKMLQLAQVRPGELVYDLGSGDGRIVILAAQKFGARAVGIELDPRRCKQSLTRIEQLDLSQRVQIIEGDILQQDLSPADVVTIFMTRYAMQKLKPRLEKFLRDGTRLVICADELPGSKATQTLTVTAENKQTYPIRLYIFSRQQGWTSFSKFGKSQ